MLGVFGALAIAFDTAQPPRRCAAARPAPVAPGASVARIAPHAAIGAALPLRFEPVARRSRTRPAYVAHGSGYVIVIDRAGAGIILGGALPPRLHAAARGRGDADQKPRATVRMRLVTPARRAALAPSGPPAGRVTYLLGRDRSRWRLGVPAYAKIVERGAWPGIDLIYYGTGGRLEFDLALAPRGRLADIRLELTGARAARVDRAGNLVLATAAGRLRLMRPAVYAESAKDAAPRRIAGRYAVLARRAGGVTVGFRLGPHRPRARVVIDPALDYASFLGGSGRDVATAVAADSAGDVFVAGMTTSPDFPVTPGALDSGCWYCSNRGGDFFASAFVSELRPAAGAAQLVYSTYFGGTTGWGGGASALALDARGYAHLAGVTDSTDFPVTPDAFDRSCADAEKPFLAILNPAAAGAAQLVYATCLGGASSYSGATALALDSAGRDYLAGYTADRDFPVTAEAFEPACAGCTAGTNEGFLSVLDSSAAGAAGLVYSTFLGGSGNARGDGDTATGLAVAAPGDVWIAGTTSSDNFPTTPDAFQPACPSAADPAGCGSGFVVHLLTDRGANALVYGTYLGGSVSGDGIAAITLAPSGAPAVAGATFSPDFPVTASAFQKKCGGECAHGNAFVAAFSPTAPSARQLSYATYLGGVGSSAGGDAATALATAANGDLEVAGAALSPDFPVTADAAQSHCSACTGNPPAPNAFVAIVRPTTAGRPSLVYATYLGGAGGFDGTTPVGDAATAIAFDPASAGLYLAGAAASADFPVTVNAFQPNCPGCLDRQGGDAFIAHFTAPASAPTPDPDAAALLEYRPGRLTFAAARVGDRARRRTIMLFNRRRTPIAIAGIALSGGGDFSVTNACGPTIPAHRRCAIMVRFAPLITGQREATLKILDSARNSPQTIQLDGTGVAPLQSRPRVE